MGKTVVLNSELVNFDGRMDYQSIDHEVVVYEHSEAEQILEHIQEAEIVVSKELSLPSSLIERFPDSVRLICEAGTGYNNIDLEAARKKGILVTNIPAYSTQRVAHTAIMLMLNLSSSMQKQLRMIEQKNYENFTHHLMVDHTEINEKTLGIIGYGHIGQEICKIAHVLGMKLLVYTRTPREDTEIVHFTTLEDVLKNSDYLSLNCPLNEQTFHLINKDTLALMKPSAFIINTSRGKLINEASLIEALKAHRLAGAGLDVQETEPLDPHSELFTLDQVIVTPHMGWKGLETRQRLLALLRDTIAAYRQGEPIHVVS